MIDKVQMLADAIKYLILDTLSMGDSLWDEAEYLAQCAGIPYTDYLHEDTEDLLDRAIKALIQSHSSELPTYLNYYFTEPDTVDEIFEQIVSSLSPTSRSQLFIAIHDIYENIGSIPGGNVVRKSIQQNIYGPLGDYDTEAIKVGKAIGQIYWKYITASEYGVISNSGSTTGYVLHDSEYAYEFSKEISDYYFRDRCITGNCPRGVGFVCRFRGSGADVIADIFTTAIFSRTEEVVSDAPVFSITISDFDYSVDNAAQQIAEYFSDNVDEAINFGINLA
jgi:hypothetical protein